MNKGCTKETIHLWLQRPSFQIGLILLVGLALYLNTFHAPFIFDDFACIRENPAIRSFSCFFDYDQVRALNIPNDIKNNFALRPVVYWTFALNNKFSGLQVFGFHLVNTGIHLLNGLLVYLLAVFTLQRTAPPSVSGRESLPLSAFLPLLIALLFVTHPLQTQAVTYISQRFTSLATLFYLAALLLYLRARTAATSLVQGGCYLLSLLITLLAMKSKEIAFTLPVMMLLYDLFFLTGPIRKRILWLFPFFLTLVVIPGTLIWLVSTNGVDDPGGKINQSLNLVNFAQVSRWDYLKTQFGVIVVYLRMLFVPVGQNLDHDYRLAPSFFAPKILGSVLLLLALFGGAVALAIRSFRRPERPAERLIAFGILWFFITIAVSSSIIPLDDLLVEYRVYLPSFGFFLAVVVAAANGVERGVFSRRTFGVAAFSIVVLFSLTTIARNGLYNDAIRLQQDMVAKSPGKLRPVLGLAEAYLTNKQYGEAISGFSRGLELTPNDVNIMINLGYALHATGKIDEALRLFEKVLSLAPDNSYAHANLGFVFLDKGKVADAEKEFRRTLQLDPHFGAVRDALARLYDQQGRTAEAIEQFRTLLETYPEDNAARERLQQLRREGANGSLQE